MDWLKSKVETETDAERIRGGISEDPELFSSSPNSSRSLTAALVLSPCNGRRAQSDLPLRPKVAKKNSIGGLSTKLFVGFSPVLDT